MAKTSADQMRAWQGRAMFSYGFRPFFLFGAIWVVLAMMIWLAALSGTLNLPSRFDSVSWHAHEFLFGYLGAVLAGFLLTAVPNWTRRLPIVGWPLAALFVLWIAGRIAVFFSANLPALVAPIIDLAFPLVLGGFILHEIVAGKNWANLIVMALLAVFILANGLFHLEALRGEQAAKGGGLRLGLATAIMMISAIGGRIVPSFTRNWLARCDSPVRPADPMQRFDKLVLLTSVLVLFLWVVHPSERHTGFALIAFSALHLARLVRWKGHYTLREPLVWILHASYAFVPLGAVAIGISLLSEIPGTAGAQHVWMAGAIGGMTLAVMTRATLGHTGRRLTADRVTTAVYMCLFGSVFARLGASVWWNMTYVSGILWVAAFAGFVWAYGPPFHDA